MHLAVPRCTTSGLPVIQTLSGANVVSVVVSAVPAACGGGTLQLTVNNGSAQSSGSTAVPVGGGNVTVTLASAVAATTTEQTDLVIVGP